MTAFFTDGAATVPVDDPTIVSGTIGDTDFTLALTFKNTSGGSVNSISLVQGTYATIAFDDTPPLSLNNNATAALTVTIPFDTLLDAEEDSVAMNTSGGNAVLNLEISCIAAGVAEARRTGVGRRRRRRRS